MQFSTVKCLPEILVTDKNLVEVSVKLRFVMKWVSTKCYCSKDFGSLTC